MREQSKQNPHFIDVVRRALGTVSYAYLISGEEAMQLLSSVRLGVSCGLIQEMTIHDINELENEIFSATLQCAGYRDAQARDHARAQLIQKKINKV